MLIYLRNIFGKLILETNTKILAQVYLLSYFKTKNRLGYKQKHLNCISETANWL